MARPPRKRQRGAGAAVAPPGIDQSGSRAPPQRPAVLSRLVPGALPLRSALLSLASSAARRDAAAVVDPEEDGEGAPPPPPPIRGPGSARAALAAALAAPGGGEAYTHLLACGLVALRGPPPSAAAFRLSQQSSQEEVKGGREKAGRFLLALMRKQKNSSLSFPSSHSLSSGRPTRSRPPPTAPARAGPPQN